MIPRVLVLQELDPLDFVTFEVGWHSRPILFPAHGVLLGSSVMTRAVSPLLQTVVLHPLVLLLASFIIQNVPEMTHAQTLVVEQIIIDIMAKFNNLN